MSTIAKFRLLANLRDGVPSDQLRSPIQRNALPVYCVILALSVGLMLAIGFTRFRFGTGVWTQIGAFLILVACALLLRRYGHQRVAGLIEAMALLCINGFLAAFMLALLCSTNFPMADHILIKADAFIGFEWDKFHKLFEGKDLILFWLAKTYSSILWQPFLLIAALFITHREKRGWIFLNAWVCSLAITVALFPFFPAVAALNFYNVAAQQGSHAADFVPFMQGIRNGGIRLIDMSSLKGIVTFPSFHASVAICLAWGFAGLPWLRWPFLLLNLFMLLATIVIGGHYLVDVIAGALIACGAIWASKEIMVYLDRSTVS
jgi:membrane-associated phospholipid phosphatase